MNLRGIRQGTARTGSLVSAGVKDYLRLLPFHISTESALMGTN